MTTRLGILVVLLLLSLPRIAAADRPGRAGFDIVLEDVALRPGVTVDIHLEVFVNPRHRCHGKVALAVPGLASTAATWGPFAEAVFADVSGQRVCRIAAVDFPGHGSSGLPAGLVFSDLLLEDYVAVVLASLERLPAFGLRPQVLVGHSQGGLLIQMAQQALTTGGTNLRRAFGIEQAVLLAPVGPREIPWAFVESGAATGLLAQFLTFDPALGVHLRIPDEVWPSFSFTNHAGVVVPGAPTPAEVAANGYNGPEPLLGALELIGAPPLARPSIDAGIFARHARTSLLVVSFEHDIFMSLGEEAALYEHLTGDRRRTGLVEVLGPDAVHAMVISDPAAVLDAITREGHHHD